VERDTSVYNYKKAKVILAVTGHCKAKFFSLAKLYGVTGNFLFELMVDEMYFDPLSPTLPRRLETTKNRVVAFFRKHTPIW